MKDYKKLIEALRLCQFGECGCGKCYYKELKGDWCTEDNHPEFFDCDDKLKLDAADAIETLRKYNSENRNEIQQIIRSNKSLVEEINRLKQSNEELREKQTYIDNCGDKWMTSAKDVPTSAYQHGYADGFAEAKQKFQKPDERYFTLPYTSDCAIENGYE